MRGRAALARGTVTSLLAMLAGCSPVSQSGGAHVEHGVLRVAVSGLPRTLNPILATTTFESLLGRLGSSILVTADAGGRFVPDLAREVPTRTNGGISSDGLTIVYRLRRGVRWHDGAPFSSRDVKFTFEAIMNPRNDVISRHGYDVVRRVDTPDDATVVFHLKRPFAPFVATVFGESDSPYGILPAHLLARYPSLNDVAFNGAPIGTGPFRVVRWRRSDRVEYEAFPGYFRGRPKLRRIVVRLVPDENTEITLLRTHEVDWIVEASVNAYKVLRGLPATRIELTRINGYQGLLMNTARGPTADPRVRRAIALGLDRRALTDRLTFGSGVPAVADLPTWLGAFDARLAATPYDPDAARKLLAAAGYGPGKKRLTLGLYFDLTTAINRLASVQVQAALGRLGIDVRTNPQLNTMLYAAYGANGTLTRGRYDLALYPWVAGVDPDDSSQFTCNSRGANGYNQSGYCSAAMDDAQRVALVSYDPAARRRAYDRIERLLLADAPLAFLWWPRNVHALSPQFHGFAPNPVNEAWNAWEWSI